MIEANPAGFQAEMRSRRAGQVTYRGLADDWNRVPRRDIIAERAETDWWSNAQCAI